MVAVRSDVLCKLLCSGWTIGMECCKSRHNTQQKILPIHSLTKLSQYVCLRSFWWACFFTICLSTCITMKSKYWWSFQASLFCGQVNAQFNISCLSFRYLGQKCSIISYIYTIYYTRRRVYVSHRELDICWFHHFHVPLGPSRICLGGGTRWGEVSFLQSWGR